MKICFVINAFDETTRQIQTLVDKLAEIYPTSDRIVIQDGTMEKPRSLKRCLYHEDAHLKAKEHGGAWTHRYLLFCLQNSDAEYIIKLDPDSKTGVEVMIPETTGFQVLAAVRTSTLPNGRNYRMPHGGALCFSRTAAQLLTQRQIFLDSRLVNNPSCFSSHDAMLMLVAQWHQFEVTDRPDFACGNGRKKTKTSSFYHP
jgi:hypothetical protein